LITNRPQVGIAPLGAAQVRRKPGEIRHLIVIQILAEEELPALQDREAARERDRFLKELTEVLVARYRGPVEPTDLVVLAVSVIIAALRTGKLVAPQDHGRSRSEQEITRIVLHHLLA